ncbi:YfjI family protein [Thermus sp.]|uniref:YfjI family protein n=2 Tax=Thermus sp. TaxID=275 RepID=UPI00298EEA67|nr:YfjI family protein [Thermus sp.]MDW8356794.1 YfjI family protein [Thermus sp.]
MRRSLTDDLDLLRRPEEFLPEELPEPTPIEELLEEPLPPFPEGILPETMEDFLVPFAARLGVDYGTVAMTALGLASGLTAGRYLVRPDPENPTWREGTNLWVAVISDPGTKKSPILKELASPLYELEALFEEEHEGKRQAYELERQAWQARRPEERGPEPKEPLAYRVVVEDATKEALAKVLRDNRGVVAVYDELKGLLSTWQKVDRQADRAFYLKAYSGGAHREDRVGRKGLFVRETWLSIVGFIQPGPFRKLILETAKGGEEADGLLQRFILVQGELTPWRKDRPVVPTQAYEGYKVFMRGLWRPPEEPPTVLHFSPEAQRLWREWEDQVEEERRNPDLSPTWRAYLGKRLSLTLRLAGVLSVLKGERAKISEETLSHAIALVEWSSSHARPVWKGAAQGNSYHVFRLAEYLLERAKEGRLPERISAWWLGKRIEFLDSASDIRRALLRLEQEGWLVRAPTKNGMAFILNPKLLPKAKA